MTDLGGGVCKHISEEIEETTKENLLPLSNGFTSKLLKKDQSKVHFYFTILSLFQGVPMIHMGDEYGHTKGGNNNTYCHDNYVMIYSLLFLF